MTYPEFKEQLIFATSSTNFEWELNKNYVDDNLKEIMKIKGFDIVGLIQPRNPETPNQIEVKYLYKAIKANVVRKVFEENIKASPNKYFTSLKLEREIHHNLNHLSESLKLTTHFYDIDIIPPTKADMVKLLTNDSANTFLMWDDIQGSGPSRFKHLDDIIDNQGIVMTIMDSNELRLKIRYYQGGEDHSEFDYVNINAIENLYKNYFIRDKEYIFKDKHLGMPFIELQYILY